MLPVDKKNIYNIVAQSDSCVETRTERMFNIIKQNFRLCVSTTLYCKKSWPL
jgi:hypothetical protein